MTKEDRTSSLLKKQKMYERKSQAENVIHN